MKSTIWFAIVLLLAFGLGGSFFYLLQNNSPAPTSVLPEFGSSVPTAGFPLPSPQSWTLLITGDVIPARVVNQKMVAKNDFRWPLTNFFELLQKADLTLINLESPLLTDCPVTNEGMKFCGDARFATSLHDAGVDVANLANNHTLNYGWEGLKETQAELGKVGIATTGFSYSVVHNAPSPPLILRGGTPSLSVREGWGELFNCEGDIYCSSFITKLVNGVSIGFLGYNAVGQQVDRELIKKQIATADPLVDVLVVSVHWGKEYTREPDTDSIAVDDPKNLGKLFIDWGADVVVGNHPHWYQPFDFAQGRDGKDKIIFYALGNFIFDQEWSPETKVGYLAKLQFSGKEIIKDELEIIPIGIKDYGQAFLLEGQEKEEVLHNLKMN